LENAASVKKPLSNLNFIKFSQFIYETEDAPGFFRGALPMIAGKALIKAVSFSSNNFALFMLQTFPPVSESALVQQYLPPSSPLQLFVAACFAGFVSSFTVNPIERIKVLMQASSHTIGNEIFALQLIVQVLKVEGWKGLLGRGLGATIAREVPAVTINFFIYELLSETYTAKDVLGPFLSPIIFGALSGMACWITVYPIDTVKTILQNSNGHDEQRNIFLLITSIYRKGGMPAFFHGLTPILLRASLNHAATFSIYAMLMHALSPGLQLK
jgi:solute carrier family 25 carnitine/acylcarnitine transporter 20/29